MEAHNGSGWDVQAEMAYNGLGQRLSMDAAGVIAYYVMDGNRPLTATTGSDTTSYLYGLGIIGEETDAWSYALTDGGNTPRQLTDAQGDVTLFVRYNPWGGTLETAGTGNFSSGYLGGILDAATNLIYVGNGQYYDPSTGRFLTRNVNPNNANPYVPWNPIGAVVGPLALFAMIASRRKGRHSKANPYLFMLLMLVVLPLSIGMACDGDGTPTPTNEPEQVEQPSTGTPTPGGDSGGGGAQSDPGAPNVQPIPCPTPGQGLYDLEIGKFPNIVQGITEAVNWVDQFLGSKSYGVLNGIYFVSANFGPGMQADTKNRRVEVSLELATYDVNYNRTAAIHELGHFVDADAGLSAFGTANADYSESHWVNEWQRHPDNNNWWLFTGVFADLPSDYLVVPNPEHAGRFCPHSGSGGVHPCAREDFAETFTWMVYENRGLRLESLDYKNDYNRPSNARIALVNAAISRLP